MMSSSISQSVLNHHENLFEEEDHQAMLLSSQVGILPNFLTNWMSLPLGCNTNSTHQMMMMSEIPLIKTLATAPPPAQSLSAEESPLISDLSMPPKLISHDDFSTPLLGDHTASHLLSLQRSSPTYW